MPMTAAATRADAPRNDEAAASRCGDSEAKYGHRDHAWAHHLELGNGIRFDGRHADVVIESVDILQIVLANPGHGVRPDVHPESFRVLRCGERHAPQWEQNREAEQHGRQRQQDA
jgi:hypothetical protein